MTEKMSAKEQVEVRANLYEIALTALGNAGYATETVKGGSLVDLGNGQFAVLNIAVKNSEKFDVDEARQQYADQQTKNAEKKAEVAAKAEAKAAKAAERTAKTETEAE